MSNFSKIVIIILIVLTSLFIKEKYGDNIAGFISSVSEITNINFPSRGNKGEFHSVGEEPPANIPVREAVEVISPAIPEEKAAAAIYFLALDSNNNSIYKKVFRDVPPDEDKLEFAIKSLLKGPGIVEKSFGAYSEIPVSTKLLGIKQTKNKVIIDFSSDFQYGGGTDSIYSRMMQLIKTALENTENKKVYLYLDGKQVSMIGGEGIMVSQPLTEKSLDM